MSTDRNPLESENIIEMARGGSDLLTANFGPRLNTSETLSSVTSVSQYSEPSSPASGETTTLTIGSGSINSGGAVVVDGQTRTVSTVVQVRVTIPANATPGVYAVKVVAATSASNSKVLLVRIRVW